MARLYFAAWESAGSVAEGAPVNENLVDISATSAQSVVVDSNGGNRARYVRIWADTNCFVTWGSNPTALNDGTEGRPVGAENPEYIWVRADHKIAVIQKV